MTINRGIGHWPPSEMDRMSLGELADWHSRAVDNIKAKNAAIEATNKGE